MESKQTTILDLNYYCIGQIVKYLGKKDHVNFCDACPHFKAGFQEWFNLLYPELQLVLNHGVEMELEADNDDVELNIRLLEIGRPTIRRMCVIGANLNVHNCVPRVCRFIKDMVNLEYIAVYDKDQLWRLRERPNRFEPIENILAALEDLPKVKTISISRCLNSYKTISFTMLRSLEGLSIANAIDIENLVEVCENNKELRVLWLHQVIGQIECIVPYCDKLEELRFTMFDRNITYVELTELPNIKKFIISSHHPGCPQLLKIFERLIAKGEASKLESLTISQQLNFEQTSKLVQLTQLKELRCSFHEPECINLLMELSDLEVLYLNLGQSDNGAEECLNVLQGCLKLQRLHIRSNLKIYFLKMVMKVLKTVRDPETQEPLQLYVTGLLNANVYDVQATIDNAYCTLTHSSDLFKDAWKLP